MGASIQLQDGMLKPNLGKQAGRGQSWSLLLSDECQALPSRERGCTETAVGDHPSRASREGTAALRVSPQVHSSA